MSKEAKHSNSMLIICHYIQVWIVPLIGWATRKSCFLQSKALPRSGAVRHYQYEISGLIPHMLIHRETTGGLIRCWLCSQGIKKWHCCNNNNYFLWNYFYVSLRKQQTFGDATTGFPAKWRLRNERRNLILMMRHYPDLGNDASPVWNFCAHLSDVTWRRNLW